MAGTLAGTLRASRSILATIARYARWRPAAPATPTSLGLASTGSHEPIAAAHVQPAEERAS